jgi:hypothetical protein
VDQPDAAAVHVVKHDHDPFNFTRAWEHARTT